MPSSDPLRTTNPIDEGDETLVGREKEASRLLGRLERAMAGDAQISLLTGEPGIGKSRLADEIAKVARRRGIPVVWGYAESDERVPLTLWAGVHRALGIAPRADPTLPSVERRWEWLSALTDAVAASAPVLVVLEDLHWADETSLWILERLGRQLAGQPVMLLATTREDEPGVREVLAGVRRIADVVDLSGLSLEDIAQLAVQAGKRDVNASDLLARTGGNPLFVHELLSTTEAGGRLPPYTGDVLRRTLKKLDTPAREAAAAVAVLGIETPLSVLAIALDRPATDLQADLDRVHATGILRSAPNGGLGFRHDLLAQAAAVTLRPDQQRRLHARAADAWEQAAETNDLGAIMAVARHRLDAVPLCDPARACSGARDAALLARTEGDSSRAVALLADAAAVLERTTAGDVDLLGRILVLLAEAQGSIGDVKAAVDTFERAAIFTAAIDDPELHAAAEIGAAQAINMFIFDPNRLRRLATAEAQLPPGDHPARAALLGRLAHVQMAEPDAVPKALARADESVAMARRLGSADLLVDALCDRHQVYVDPAGIAARAAAVDEMMDLARRHGRPDLARRGWEWRFSEQFDVGDLTGAWESIDRLEALAAVMPSPRWRTSVLLRQRGLLHLEGHRERAEAITEQATVLGSQGFPVMEMVGVELGGRISAAVLWGTPPDEKSRQNFELADSFMGKIPVPFFQIRLAQALFALGDMDRARWLARRYIDPPGRLILSSEGVSTLHIAGMLAAELGLRQFASSVSAALVPYAGRLGAGNGIGFSVPIDTTLGRLALLNGDTETATVHMRASLAFAQRVPSPPVEVWARAYLSEALEASDKTEASRQREQATTLADQIGLVLPKELRAAASAPRPTAGLSRQRIAALRRDRGQWRLTSSYGETSLPPSRGIEQLARLLGRPGIEVAAIDLADSSRSASDLGPALDSKAKLAYRRRMHELQGEIDEAESFHDPARADRARVELDSLMAELRRAVGLGGRDRPNGSGTERARVNVTRSLKRAIAIIEETVPDLGPHLRLSVQTGRYCVYRPDPSATISWTVEP